MPNQLVTVDAQTLDFPQAVKNKLAEYFPTIAHANNIATASAGQFVNLNSSSTAGANKIAKRDSNGFFEVLDAVSAKQPVSLSQLDARVPEGGYPVASQLRNGLMSSTDKNKLDTATASPTPSTIVMRNLSGGTRFDKVFIDTDPTEVDHATRKNYVDAQIATRALSAHKHDASDVNAGTFDPLRLPLVTTTVNGAMLATDKSKLDKATSLATPNTLVTTDANGRFQSATPSATADVATKGYVDGKKWDGADITTGTISPLRIANVTSSLDGLMSKADKSLLDGATTSATPSTLMRRNTSGDVMARGFYMPSSEPQSSDGSSLTRKDYVDAQVATRALSSHNHSGADITSGTIPVAVLPVATTSVNGIMLSSDKAKLDGASSLSSNSTLAMRNSTGGITFAVVGIDNAPSASQHATRKDYVDAQVATRAPSSHNHDGSDITTGLINQARIANATSSLNGLMSSADKSKLDGASAGFTAGALAIRDSNGNLNANGFFTPSGGTQSVYAHSLTRKDYVDGLIAQQVTLAGELGSSDLNTITTPGDYYASGGANATIANNYPFNGAVGTLSVRRFHSSSIWVTQTLTIWSKNEVWVRSANSSTGWTAWMLQATTSYVDAKTWSGADITTGTINPARIANATSSLDGLMSKADKAKLDGASSASTANTIMMTDSAGRFRVNTPSASTDATNKAYVDGKTWDGADITTGTISPLRIANATASLDGLMSKADKAKLDKATPASTPNTLVLSDSAGRFQVPSPSTNSLDVVNRGYVDAKTWSGSDITSGTINPARIANATSSVDGLMSKADKAKLDNAGYHPTGASLVMSSSTGYIKGMAMFVDENTPQQTQAHALTRKDYVDGKIADVFVGTEIPDSANLNNYTTPGVYHNSTNTSVASGTNYPSTLAGKLEVSKSASGSMIYQTWTDYTSAGRVYYRTKYSSSWYSWKELINNLNVTQYAQGELPKLTYSTANGNLDSYKTAGTYLIANGGMSGEGGLLEVFVSADGDVCQRLTLQGTMNKGGYKIRWYNEGPSLGGGRYWKNWQAGY